MTLKVIIKINILQIFLAIEEDVLGERIIDKTIFKSILSVENPIISKKYVIYSEVGNKASMINFHFNNVVPRAAVEKYDPNTSQIYSRDPNRYSIQKDLYEGGINSFDNVSENLRM